MSQKTLILLAAVCLVNVLPVTAASAEPVETSMLVESDEDGGTKCIAVDLHAFPPVYWYDCG